MNTISKGMLSLLLVSIWSCQKNEAVTTQTKPPPTPTASTMTGGSNFIDSATANVQIASYLSSIDTFSTDQIKSFFIDAASLRTYLADNTIQELKIFIGHQSGVMGSSLPTPYQYLNSGSTSLILVGIDANSNYVYYNYDEVINRSRDCPINCPITGNAGQDLLAP